MTGGFPTRPLRGRAARLGWLICLLGAALTLRADDAAGSIVIAPLAPRSGPRGATMFKFIPPAQTGVVTDNNYDDPRMWGERYQELVFGAIGCGVAIGDYDNDGRPDLFVVSKTGRRWLFRNLGGWKFEDVTDRAGLGEKSGGWTDKLESLVGLGGGSSDAQHDWNAGVTFVDVNNDGWLDLYVCRFAAPNLLYINQHDGTFKEEAAARGLAVNDACGMAAFCDYDRDGWLDVFIQTNMRDAVAHPNGQRNYLFHNNGDGTFTDVTARAGIRGEACGHSATWWDYDGDGWPDLYVADDYGVADRLYHNNHDGTFTDTIDRVVPHMPYYSMGSDFGDVNNDGLVDFFAADMAPSTHEADQRGMADSRARAQKAPADPTAAPQTMHDALYLNTGLGRMREAAFLAGIDATDWTWSPRLEDLDNDGRLDLVVTNGMIREYHNIDMLKRVMAAESTAESRRMIRATPMLAEPNRAFRNLGDLQFQEVGAAWGLNQRGVSFGSAFGDLDGDGDLDFVCANYQRGVSLLRNDSDSGHRLIVALHGVRSNRFGIGAVVRIETASGVQVRPLMLARGYMSSSEPIAHFGLGADTRIERLTVEWPSGHVQTFKNLPVDRRVTITEPSEPAAIAAVTPPKPGQFQEVGEAMKLAVPAPDPWRDDDARQPLLALRQDHRGPAVAVGALAADGGEAIVLGGSGAAGAQVARGAVTLPAAASVHGGPVLAFDADGDGRHDLLLTGEGRGQLLINAGHGSFRVASDDALPALPANVGALAAADFDRDGRLDLFVGARALPGRYPISGHSVLLRNVGGRFEDVTDAVAPGLREVGIVNAALWTDVDGDGWPDLLLAVEWGGVRYFHNEAGRGFADWSERAGFAAAGTGWWTSLAAADFNGDGRLDYVAGNLGLNTRYHADAAHPALLFYGTWAEGGGPLAIEGYYEGDKFFPWLTRDELAVQVPWIARRFAHNDLYARSTLEEILGADRLAAARRFAATEFRSGVFLSQPDGTYRFAPLPRIAQIAPLQGIVAGDFDGDGHADIYAVQNSYAPVPAVGRFDGGLSQLLRGDGHGNFAAVPPAKSGLVVPGDAKALAVLDLDGDGWPDFFVTRNDATTLAFRNGGVAGHRSLRVVLHGPRGNPDGVGARVTAERADGATETAEVHAGSGFQSQSSAAVFFGCPEANPIRRVRVRWPSGATSSVDVPAGATTLSVGPG